MNALRHISIVSSGSVTCYALWRRKFDPLHVVWDLDHTLLCSVCPIPEACDEPQSRYFDQIDDDFAFKEGVPNTRTYWRPGAYCALRVIGLFAEQHVFTAAQASYTQNIMARLDPECTLFKSVTHRDAVPECVKVGKDLSLLKSAGGADNLRRMLLVDDKAKNFRPQAHRNGVLTKPYKYKDSDGDSNVERVEMLRIVGISFLSFLWPDARDVVRALDLAGSKPE